MIVFDLKCGHDHVFEAWFGSSTAYEEQRAGGLIACPICGDADVSKAVMAPNVGLKGNQRGERAPVPSQLPVPAPAMPAPASSGAVAPPSAEALKAAMAAIAAVQAKLLEQSQWVGMAFADKARAMHLGEEPEAVIHGQVTSDEAKALIEEGVPVAPLLVPVVPPEALN